MPNGHEHEQDGSLGRQWLRTGWKHRETVLWLALLAIVLTVQWPVLKGWYYRATDATAPASAVAWQDDLDAALAEARSSGRRVLVEFSASWCPSCVAMKHDVWPDPAVARAVEAGYIAVSVDTDRNGVLPARYQVDAIPTLILLDADGRVVKRNDGFLPRSGVLRFFAEAAR
ncbi:MAG: thioredoxin family protein [Vicinamibacterales bacterium]|nr:thioredoxin family protein [Vicinamibacterales bacterium]